MASLLVSILLFLWFQGTSIRLNDILPEPWSQIHVRSFWLTQIINSYGLYKIMRAGQGIPPPHVFHLTIVILVRTPLLFYRLRKRRWADLEFDVIYLLNWCLLFLQPNSIRMIVQSLLMGGYVTFLSAFLQWWLRPTGPFQPSNPPRNVIDLSDIYVLADRKNLTHQVNFPSSSIIGSINTTALAKGNKRTVILSATSPAMI